MKKIVYVLALFFIAVSCESLKEKSLSQINRLENSDSIFNLNEMQDLYAAYVDFAVKFPDDEQTPHFLFKAAQRSHLLSKANEGVKLLEKILVDYPNSNYCEDALLTMGYMYENELKEFEKAKETYEMFLKKYPKSNMTMDVKLAIENIGKTPEEIINGFNKENLEKD